MSIYRITMSLTWPFVPKNGINQLFTTTSKHNYNTSSSDNFATIQLGLFIYYISRSKTDFWLFWPSIKHAKGVCRVQAPPSKITMIGVVVGLLRSQNMAKHAFFCETFPLAYILLYSSNMFTIRTQAEAALFCPHLHYSKMAAKNIYIPSYLIIYRALGDMSSAYYVLILLSICK